MIDSNTSRRPSRIAYVVKRYPRFSETFIVNELLAHEAAGLDVEIFSLRPPSDTHFQDVISVVKAPVSYLSNGRTKSPELWDALRSAEVTLPRLGDEFHSVFSLEALEGFCALRLAIEIVRKGITHIHAHFASSSATVARAASKLTGVPYSITAHAKDIFHQSTIDGELAQKLQDASTVFTVSDFNLDYLRTKFGEAAESVTRLYNGLPLECFPFESPKHRSRQVIAVGRLVEKKGFSDLIEACHILRSRGVHFQCKIVGGGELEGQLRTEIDRRDLTEVVELTGPQPQSVVKRMVQQACLLAAPCVDGSDGNRDGLPTVLLEAMALGTPCIATRVTGIPEAIREDTGVLVQQHSPLDLANGIEVLLGNPEMRSELASAARALVEKEFDIHRNTAKQREYFSGDSCSPCFGKHLGESTLQDRLSNVAVKA